MKKSKAKKATTKKKVVKARPTKSVRPAKSKKNKAATTAKKISKKVAPAKCKHPTTLFEVEFPTTLLFWAGVTLFFFIMVLIAKSII